MPKRTAAAAADIDEQRHTHDDTSAHRTRTNARLAAMIRTDDGQWMGPLDVHAVTVDDEGTVTATLTEVMTPHAVTRPQA